jgi:4-amino-4-deoxy-L-arabinose transferase-like glycosyltransferase
MNAATIIKWTGYIASVAILIFGFLFLYSHTHEWISSLTAAILSSLLVLVSFIMLRWLAEVFMR